MNADQLPPAIAPAELTWREGVPSPAGLAEALFDGALLAGASGLDQSRFVFLSPNDLGRRFGQVPPGGHFVVAETGFGAGLNFLAAWQAWQLHRPEQAGTLHFVSVEPHPLSQEDLQRALANWPELSAMAKELTQNYPALVRGTHRLVLDGGRVRLTLHFGDVVDGLRALDFTADAWFLGGFASDHAPDTGQNELLELVRKHSKPGTTLATQASASPLRQSLEANGFVVSTTPGFNSKGEIVSARWEISLDAPAPEKSESVLVLGAGVAGCLLAHNLAERGISVTLVDSADRVGAAASGNLQAAMYVKLGVEFNHQTELALSALTFSQRFYRPYRDQFWHPTGLLQLAWSDTEQDRQRRFLERNQYPAQILYPVDRNRAKQLTGVQTPAGGLWFPGSGWLEPPKLCRQLASHPRIEPVTGFTVDRLARDEGGWRVRNAQGEELKADRIVICAGHRSPELIPLGEEYRFKSIRGQVTHLPEATLDAPTAVICGSRYLNPPRQGVAVAGATFDLRDSNPDPTEDSHQENLQAITEMLPGILNQDAPTPGWSEALVGRVAFRCTTHDYQPVAGILRDRAGKPLENVFLFTGLGSKGLTYAPLLAEYMADQLAGQPSCLPVGLEKRVETRRMLKPVKSAVKPKD